MRAWWVNRSSLLLLGSSLAGLPLAVLLAVLGDEWAFELTIVLSSWAAATAIVAAVRRFQPKAMVGWYALATCLMIATVVELLGVFHVEGKAHELADMFSTAGSLVVGAFGVAAIVRARGAADWDFGALLDFTILVTSVGIVMSHVVLPLWSHDIDLAKFVALLTSASCVGVLALVARLLSHRTGTFATRSLAVAVVAGLASGVTTGLTVWQGWLPATLQLVAALGISVAASHPSMVHLSEPSAKRVRQFSASRVALLVGALAIPPSVQAAVQWRDGRIDAGWLGAALLIALGVGLRVRSLLDERDAARSQVLARTVRTEALAALGRDLVTVGSRADVVDRGLVAARAGSGLDVGWQDGGGHAQAGDQSCEGIAAAGGHLVVARAPVVVGEACDPDIRGFLGQIGDMMTIAADRLRSEERLRDAQKIQAVGKLAAGLAHEMNTPLQFVEHNVRFLYEGFSVLEALVPAGIDDERLEFYSSEAAPALQEALHGLGRTAEIVEAMRTIGDPGNASVVGLLDVNDVVMKTVTMMRHELQSKVGGLETNLAATCPARGTPADLYEVVAAVLANAMDELELARPEGDRRIRVGTVDMERWVRIEVADNGRGISDRDRSRVWEQFFTTKGVSRTGLGLSMARSLMERNGGRLDFRSSASGTTFAIDLPAS